MSRSRCEHSFTSGGFALALLLSCSSVSPPGSVPRPRSEAKVPPRVEQPSQDIVGIPGADGDKLDFRDSRYCLKYPAQAVRLQGEGNRIAVPLQPTTDRVTLPAQLYFEKTITLKPSGALVIPVRARWYLLEEPEALQELGDLTVQRFQPCAAAATKLNQILSAVVDRFHVMPLQRCRWSRYLEELPETNCTMVKEVEELGLDRYSATVNEGGRKVVSVVVANSAIMYHVLSSQGRVACPPVQASTTERALVASLAILQAVPNSEQSVEFWPRGCFGTLVGTIEGDGPSSEELTALLDSFVTQSRKSTAARPARHQGH